MSVKSVYLSTTRYITGSENEEEIEEQARYSTELDKIARLLQNGHDVKYDEGEMARLRHNLELMRSIPREAVWGAVFRFALPGIVFTGIVWLVYFLLRLVLR